MSDIEPRKSEHERDKRAGAGAVKGIGRRLLLGGLAGATGLTVLGSANPALGTHGQTGTDPIRTGGIYPRGELFPLGWYDIGAGRRDDPPEPQAAVDAMRQQRQFGWNFGHRYTLRDVPDIQSYLRQAHEGRMGVLTRTLPLGYRRLEIPPEDVVAQHISALAQSDRVIWWDFPEELRPWFPELQVIQSYSDRIRKYDPQQRPRYMYSANYRDADFLARVTPYLDIVALGCYNTHRGMPPGWLRWHVEELIRGIRAAGANIGPDYLNGEKTPVAALELYWNGVGPFPTPATVYHNFWQALVSGARGIIVFSYYRRLTVPNFEPVLDAYNQAAAEFTGPEHIDNVILYGTDIDRVAAEVTDGPARTQEFTDPPAGVTEPVSFSSIDLLAKAYRGRLYVIAVNSSDQPVTARLSGLSDQPRGTAFLPLEQRSIQIINGQMRLDFAPLGVHILRTPLGSAS